MSQNNYEVLRDLIKRSQVANILEIRQVNDMLSLYLKGSLVTSGTEVCSAFYDYAVGFIDATAMVAVKSKGRTINTSFKVYTFEDASKELRDKIREQFSSCGDYGSWMLDERIETLKAFAEYIGGTLQYSISVVPDRGEFIRIDNFDQAKFRKSLSLENCPFTGVCYDDDLLNYINKFGCLKTGLHIFLQSTHTEFEHMLTDEYLKDHCEANGYEFTEDGKLYAS